MSARFLLIHSPVLSRQPDGKTRIEDIRIMPVGLIAIANNLKAHGIRAQVLHLGLELILNPRFKIEQYIKTNRFDCVGISIHWYQQLSSSLALARRIKRHNKNIFLVLGGLSASFFAAEIMKENLYLDGIIRGDGELPALALAREINRARPDLGKVPNLVWRGKGAAKSNALAYIASAADIARLDFADLSTLKNARQYLRRRNEVGLDAFMIVAGRGCPNLCTYCGGSSSAQKKICRRSALVLQRPEKVVATIVKAQKQGWRRFSFPFDPVPNSGYYPKIFRLLRKKGIITAVDFESWGLPSRALIDDLLKTFKDVRVEISPECYSEVNRKKNKDRRLFYSNQELEAALAYMLRNKIEVKLFFGYFLPHEKLNDIFNTLNYILGLKDRFGSSLYTAYAAYSTDPASAIYFHPGRYKMLSGPSSFSDYLRLGPAQQPVLYRPRYFSKQQATDIRALIMLVMLLESALPQTRRLIKQITGGDYLWLIEKIYSYIKGTNRPGFLPKRLSSVLEQIIHDRHLPGILAESIKFELGEN